MATTKEFYDYVAEQLQRVGDITTRKMMGEYCVYYKGKIVGGMYDNQLLLKTTESSQKMLPDAEKVYPYEGSKSKMLVVEEVEDTTRLAEIMAAMYDELPMPRKRKKA